MRSIIISILFVFIVHNGYAQSSFTGLVKYHITVEGMDNAPTDSMMVVFDKDRVRVVMYLPDLADPQKVDERSFIDDFENKISYVITESAKSYKEDSLKTESMYVFTNTQRYGTVGRYLCFDYKAKPASPTGEIPKTSCLCSIDYLYTGIKDYSFLGYQPIVIDNRIVLDYTVTQSNGTKPKVYATDIIPMTNVEKYFNIEWYIKKP